MTSFIIPTRTATQPQPPTKAAPLNDYLVMLMQEPNGALECWAGDSLSDDPSDVVTFHVYLKATQAGTFTNTTGVDASMTYQNTATANTTASQTITAQ